VWKNPVAATQKKKAEKKDKIYSIKKLLVFSKILFLWHKISGHKDRTNYSTLK